MTPAKAEALQRLDEETAQHKTLEHRPPPRPRFVAGERISLAMEDFVAGLAPPRHPSPELEAERRARFRAECNVYKAASGIEAEFLQASLEDLDPRLPEKYCQMAHVLKRLLDVPGQVMLIGDRGRGKTWLACGAVNAFCAVGRRAIYRRTRDLFNELSKAEWSAKDRIRRSYLEPAMLVLDEVQVRDADREWQDNELTDLIDRRWARHRSTVMLANCKPDTLLSNVGASIHRRVIESGGIWTTDWVRIKPLFQKEISDAGAA